MTEQEILAFKRQKLDLVKSTIPLSAGTQTTHSRVIQVDTPQPLPAYPIPGAAPVVILQYRVPPGMSGALNALAIAHLGVAGSFIDGSGNLLWRFLINGAPQKGLENLYVQIGSPNQLAPMFLLLRENSLIQATVQVPAGMITPAGSPFARILGYLDFGGLGAQAPTGGVGVSGTGVAAAPTPNSPAGISLASSGSNGSNVKRPGTPQY